jgi:ATP-dependent Lon protease
MPENARMRSRRTDEDDSKKKSGSKSKLKAPKRGDPPSDDDVDERGNLKGLIVEEEESDSEAESEVSYSPSEIRRLKRKGHLPESLKEQISGHRPVRKAAVKAREVIKKKAAKAHKITPSTESSDSTWKDRRKTRRRKSRKVESESEESEESEEEDEEEDEEDSQAEEAEEDEDEDEEDEDEEDEEDDNPLHGFTLSLFGGDDSERMVPKRHNMKKESADVKQFVKLVTNPTEANTIDDQIDQFKSLEPTKQRSLLTALEARSDSVKKEQPLMFKLLQMNLTPDTMGLVMARYNSLNTMDPSSGEYYKLRTWMEKLVSIPLGVYKEMPVKIEDGQELTTPFMEKARRCLEEAIYGQEEAKLQILQFIASKIANPTASGLSLMLVGPPGIGKTSLIKNGIAKALEWPFQFMSRGGDSDASTYMGHQFVYEGSHCGKIANCVAQAKSMSMILMFDELDKISYTEKGQEIQNLLVHLTDPVQNMLFEDKYLTGIPLDMSRAMFVFSGNDLNKIDRVLLDRMIVVNLSGYKSKDKMEIAEKYLLPAALKEVNLTEKVAVSREVLQHILDHYATEESGVRELKRCIEQIVQRINMLRMFNVKDLPFHIPGFTLPFVLKKEHVDLFIKKRELGDKPPEGMYA